MNIYEAMAARHAVRMYRDIPIEKEKADKLNELLEHLNSEGNLHLQLILNEPKTFSGFMAHYGSFKGVKNYIAVVGKNDDTFSERAGYYAQNAVLLAQTLGLNTCWVAQTFSKSNCRAVIGDGEKLICAIALGYGEYDGIAHTSKPESDLSEALNPPDWYSRGMAAAMLAPTALNQQKFKFKLLSNNVVSAKALLGFYTKVDLGIAKCQFEIGAGKENFSWEK